jgi:DNA replication protein DnaC
MKWLKKKELLAKTYSWRSLNKVLIILTEEQLSELLDQELESEKRWSVVQRLHQRYTVLRAARERAELKKQVAA